MTARSLASAAVVIAVRADNPLLRRCLAALAAEAPEAEVVFVTDAAEPAHERLAGCRVVVSGPVRRAAR